MIENQDKNTNFAIDAQLLNRGCQMKSEFTTGQKVL